MPQVNGDNLLHQQIVKRTIEALQAQDEAFAIEYETASDADLIAYVRQCVDVSYTPAPCEVVGGAYIAQRFGNWSAALKAAGCPRSTSRRGSITIPATSRSTSGRRCSSYTNGRQGGRPRPTSSLNARTATRPAPPPTPRKRTMKNDGCIHGYTRHFYVSAVTW